MGKLLIFLAIIVVTVILLGLWGLFLDRQKQKQTLGLQNTKKRVMKLEGQVATQTAVLTEIHELAQTELTLAEDNGTDIHMWLVVRDKAAETLKEETKR